MPLPLEATEGPVIRQDDPLLAEHPQLDFQFLRSEGLRHLGELSGKIWTDHNAHDPGVTILEALCYALLDLGYRTTLPVEDLLATAPGVSSPASQFPADDNFFTALEILSCNPTTIGDYRKLLLEVEGVRNAWLVPANEQEIPLSLVARDVYGLETGAKLVCDAIPDNQIRLNGLYSILIEKELEADDDKVRNGVRTILSAYRNLCEDFKDIVILCPFGVGICADVEIETTANVDLVYKAVLEAVQSYIGPEIRYYTLKQILDKGRAIEEVFAGRPLMIESNGFSRAVEEVFASHPLKIESVGFVDTEELNSLPLRKDLYASDLYQAILNVKGVVSIRDLSFQADTTATNGNIQRLRIPDASVAVFSLKRTCVQVRGGQSILHFDKEKIHKGLLMNRKSRFHRENLDIPIPQGRFDSELSDYQSVQYDFPVVYGIGEGGLPEDATPLRKLQARQLQGYLLFYDQLLANYLAQMVNVRSLFSLQQESKRSPSQRRTYFSEALESVPGVEQLLQINTARDLTDGCVIAVPVANDATLAQRLQELGADPEKEFGIEDSCGAPPGALSHFADATATLQEIRIQQSMRDLEQSDYGIEFYQDRGGHFFILRFTQASALVLVSYRRYSSAAKAREAANMAAFLATRPEYYRKSSRQNSQGAIDYRYDVVSNAAANADYLQYLVENEQLYLERREVFLDHLLARFAHQFTDYALVRFSAANGKEKEQEQAVEDKSRFLSQYDDLSRNRGRAFNYLEPSWLTPNVSGYERRVSLLAGMSEWMRRRLCKFEVVPCHWIEINDLDGRRWFSSKGAYHSKRELEQVLRQLKDPARYPEVEGQFIGFKADTVRRIFSEIPADENIQVSQHVYGLQLKDGAAKVRQQSKTKDYATETLAWAGLSRFLDEVKEAGESGLELAEVAKSSRVYLDQRQLQYRIARLASYKWHQYDENGERIAGAEKAFPDVAAAIADFAQSGDWSHFITQEDGFGWRLTDEQGAVLLRSFVRYDDAAAAVKGLLEAMEAAQSNENYRLVGTTDQPEYRIELGPHGGPVLGTTPPPSFADAKERAGALKTLRKAMKRLHPPLKVEKEPEQYRWHLSRVPGGEAEAESSQTFQSKKETTEDFETFVRRIAQEEPQSHIAPQVYAVELLPIPVRYRFVYCVNSSEGEALPLLYSAQEFQSSDAAREAYTGFVRTLPTLQRSDANIVGASQVAAVLAEDTKDNRQKADKLLALTQEQSAATGEKGGYRCKWIYRLLDKDHPIAKDCYDPKEDVQNDLKTVCGFVPLRLECEQLVLRVICPTLDPKNFHYAICLPDDDGKEFTFLISYLGYESREAACRAGESHWIQVIELATDSGNYGEAEQIAPEEVYGATSGVCAETEPYLAVMANEFREEVGAGAVEKAVKLAKRYPIRITYMEDSGGKPTKEIKGYHFQGYDLALDKCIWQSTKVYPNPQEALDAYRVFAVVLRNCDSCRIVCEEGRYRIHLVEILAESAEFDTEENAWGEPQSVAEDACGRLACRHQGVRLFADTAIAEAAFIPKQEDGCYQFTVVGSDYRVARHTCDYDTARERDEALEKLHNWALDITCRSYEQTVKEEFLCYSVGEGYFLQSVIASRDWKEFEINQIVDRWFYLVLGKADADEPGMGPQYRSDSLFYRKVGNEWHLIDPFEGDVPIARLRRETESGEFSIEAFQRLVREYPVFKKGDRYCFRLFYPANGGVLDETLEICGCDEPTSNGQEARSFCGNPYLFESVQCYPCRAAAEEAFDVFCGLVKDQGNYDYESGCIVGPYSFTIIDPKKVLATHPNCHPGLGDAMRAAERARACLNDEGMHLVEHILLRPQAHNRDAACECLLPVCPDVACTLIWQEDLDEDDPCAAAKNPPLTCIPGSDPYSFWATLVLPGWYRRFKGKASRQFFKEMLYREVPAMVGLNILWLSPRQMCEFDEAFRTWLEWRRDPCLLCEDDGNALCDLVNCIKLLVDDLPCPSAEIASGECDCLPKADYEPYHCIDQANQLFWLECDQKEHSVDQENEGPQPDILAPMVPTADASTGKQEKVSVNPAAVRQIIAQREDTYRKNVEAADKQVKATKGYQRAKFFVSNSPSLDAFRQLATQILDKDVGRKRTRKSLHAFTFILQNATWYLLDRLVQTHLDEVPEEVKTSLSELVAAMKAKGMDTSCMAKDWKSESLEKVLPASAIQQYLRLLEGA